MAVVAHDVMVEAERTFRFAPALAEAMEPHLLSRISGSKIYSYTNEREDRNVPPGDVLLAAALAARISIDQKLGIAADPRDGQMADMRARLADMQEQINELQRQLKGGDAPTAEPSDELAAAKSGRAVQRRAWAQQSRDDAGPTQPIRRAQTRGRTGP